MAFESFNQRVRSLWYYLKSACRALIAPETLRAEHNVKMFRSIVSTLRYLKDEERKDIVWQYKMYLRLGLPKAECRRKIISLIENRSGHLEKNELSYIIKQLKSGDLPDQN
jgi:hypothetical protein